MADLQGTVPIDVLVAVIAVVNISVQALAQVVVYFVSRASQKSDEGVLQKILEAVERMNDQRGAETHMIHDLYDMHKVTDSEGRPIWYFPGSIIELVKQVSDSQADTARILETLVRQLDNRRNR